MAKKISKTQNRHEISETQYLKELFFQTTSDLMLFLDTLGRITRINRAGKLFSGFKEEEIIGKLFWTLPGVFSKRNIPKYLSVFKNSLRGRIVKDFQGTLTDKQGKQHIMNFSTYPIIKNKKVQRILVIGKDITNELEIKKSLRKTRDLYRLITENTSDMIATMRFDSTYTYISPSHKALVGYTSEDLLGKKGFDFVHPEDKKKLIDILRKYISARGNKILDKKDSEISENFVYRVKHKNGTWRYFSTTANIIENEILFVSKDITESIRKTEEILQESEEKFINLAEESPNMIFINQNGKIKYANQICEQIIGYKLQEIYSPDFDYMVLIAPESKDDVIKSFEKHMKGKDVPPYEYTLITRKGKRIESLLSTKLIKYMGENAILGIVTDITDRKRVEEKTRTLKDHFQNIINSASEFIISFDINNRISEWNMTAENITGYKKSEITGKSILSLELIENTEYLLNHLKQIYYEDFDSIIELILKTKSGSKRVIQASGSIMYDSDSNPIGIIIIGKDITKDIEMHGKLLNGNSYIIVDKDNNSALNLFMDLRLFDLSGLLITRDIASAIYCSREFPNINILLLSQEKVKEFDIISDLEGLKSKIKEFIKKAPKSLILLDRIDYLFTIFSFDDVIKYLYNIVNFISNHNAILLVRCNPLVLTDSQLALLEEELMPLPSKNIDDIELEENIFEVLEYIKSQNNRNIQLTFSKIGQAFSITKVTVAKRLKILEEKDLIIIKKQGREKIVHISDKGISLLNKRKVI
jgi:PAS domain S-box-containing protein